MKPSSLQTLHKQLADKAIDMGARFFGVADLAHAANAVIEQGGSFLASYPRALSIGIALADDIVDQLFRHKEISVARTYDALYNTVNQSLDRIALRLSTSSTEV